MVDIHIIVISGAKVFLIADESEQNVELYFDHTEITKENFEIVVEKENKCASFYIHLIVSPTKPNEPVFKLSVSVTQSVVMFYVFCQYICIQSIFPGFGSIFVLEECRQNH